MLYSYILHHPWLSIRTLWKMASFHQKCCGNSSSSLTFSSSSIRSDFSLYLSLALCLFVYLNSIGTSSSSKRWKQFTWSYIPRHSIEVYFYLVSFLKGFQEMNFLMTLDFRNIKRFICKQWHFSALEESFSLLLSLSYMPEEREVSRYM